LSSIPIDDDADEAIIVIGDTGVGKSTIMNFLAGTELHVECEGLKPTLICLGESQIKIGH
jgi:ABC-type nitrate/sulfonate/bicarbonate transport system ATPase subunit